jgi:hypothetical protein
VQNDVDTPEKRCSVCDMWKSLIALVVVATPALAQERATAYEALRVVGTQLNRDAVNHVISVTGVNGDPQPETWKVLMEDRRAQGGLREVEVANGRVVSERTPLRQMIGSTSAAVIDTNKLNLDSNGAYTVASHTADRSHAVFRNVSYTLRTDERGNPIWIVTLETNNGARAGTIHIGANHGSVVRTEGMFSGTNTAQADDQQADEPSGGRDPDDEDGDTNIVKLKIKRAFRITKEETRRAFKDARRSFRDFIDPDH